MTHDLKRKAVWNSTYEQIKADMKWHTQTLLEKRKQSKEEDYLKKGSTTHPGVMQWESYCFPKACSDCFYDNLSKYFCDLK